jgi:hypothetical protein
MRQDLYFEFLRLLVQIENSTPQNNRNLKELICKEDLDKDLDLFHFLVKTGIGGYVYSKLSSLNLINLPESTFFQLKKHFLFHSLRNEVMLQELEKVKQEFRKNNIEFICLKGAVLIEKHYNDLGSRVLSDCDLLLARSSQLKAMELMSTGGFTKKYEQSTDLIQLLEIPTPYSFSKKNITIDFHLSLQRRGTYKIETLKLFENQLNESLEIHDELIHLCIHLFKHVNRGNAKFYHLIDIHLLLNIESTDWLRIKKRATDFNCLKAVNETLYIVHSFLNSPINIEIRNQITQERREELIQIAKKALSGDGKETFRFQNIYLKEMTGLPLSSILFAFFRKTFPDLEFIRTNYCNKNILMAYFLYWNSRISKFKL